MDIEQVIDRLENRHSDPLPLVETLIANDYGAAASILNRLDSFKVGQKIPNAIERVQYALSSQLKAQSFTARRMVVALGALKASEAIPSLLRILANSPFDQKLSQAAGWALANLGEAAVMPLFLFARCSDLLAHARSLAIVTLGYIADARVPSILHFLWREVRLERPNLAIAALIALTMQQGFDEAHKLALETERLWSIQEKHGDQSNTYWMNMKFTSSIETLHDTLAHVRSAPGLPEWTKILPQLEVR